MAVDKKTKYFNRELSWLEFNHRVLEEALDPTVPLLERLKFLAITSSNLDEFFMVRVGGLQMLAEEGVRKRDPTGLTPKQQLARISQRTHEMVNQQHDCYLDDLEPQLAREGIRRVRSPELTPEQSQYLENYFNSDLFPVISPMAIRTGQDFPTLTGRLIYLGVRLKPSPDGEIKGPRYAVIPLGRRMDRFITLPGGKQYTYILLEDAVGAFIDRLFPGEPVVECVPFRITRNADMGVREDLAGDLLAEMKSVLDARKRSDCVRLEVDQRVSQTMMKDLKRSLNVDELNIYRMPGPLDFSTFMSLAGIEGYDNLRYKPWPPQPSPQVDLRNSIFGELASKDMLLYHPFDSFDPVQRLVEEAADDPDVLAIKQILYRSSKNSPIVAALMRAAEQGKYVTAIVELKARFDEARNIDWALALEQAGVQVIYGVKGLKTHAKLCIVVRREPHGIQRYMHFGTGNYNEATARLYTDISYMTCDQDLGMDASTFFNAITGYSQPQKYRMLEAAPMSLRDKTLEMIEGEIIRKKQGQKALIMAKMNSLVDPKIIHALYRASGAGVTVKLNVRGICCLRPGVPGLSKNITVTSIVDRLLEHSRIFYYHQGGAKKVFISSADWMQRNLDRRVELLVPVDNPASRKRLVHFLETCFSDSVKARTLKADGTYVRAKPGGKKAKKRSQEALYNEACDAVQKAEQANRMVFEPHRPSDQSK